MKFTIVENTQQAAIYINKMDNNFPERVKDIVFILDKMKQVPIITLEDILKAHRYLIKRFGIYDILISDDIRGILPVGKPEIFQSMNQSGCDYLIAWYKAFQEIHPFK